MKRDMDLVRDILLRVEGGQRSFEVLSHDTAKMLHATVNEPLSQEQADKLERHLELLEQAGLIEIEFKSMGGEFYVKGLTWSGYDFLGSIKDKEVWEQTKAAAKRGGVETLEFFWEIAKAAGRKEFSKRVGLDL